MGERERESEREREQQTIKPKNTFVFSFTTRNKAELTCTARGQTHTWNSILIQNKVRYTNKTTIKLVKKQNTRHLGHGQPIKVKQQIFKINPQPSEILKPHACHTVKNKQNTDANQF